MKNLDSYLFYLFLRVQSYKTLQIVSNFENEKSSLNVKVIYSKYLPVKGFRAINLFGVIFARNDEPSVDKRIINHERIHTRQMLETLVIGFYVWYVFEWLAKWIIYKDRFEAYKNIGFEREAFDNDRDMNYLKTRKRFAFVKYLRRK